MIEDKQGSEEKLIADLVSRVNAQVSLVLFASSLYEGVTFGVVGETPKESWWISNSRTNFIRTNQKKERGGTNPP
jgi:hypothetical protein